MFLITTSRRPSKRTRSFLKEFSSIFSGSYRINRGKLSLRGLLAEALIHNCRGIILINTYKGNPGSIDFYVIKRISEEESLDSYRMDLLGRIFLTGVVLARERLLPPCVGISNIEIVADHCVSELCRELKELITQVINLFKSIFSADKDTLYILLEERKDFVELRMKTSQRDFCGFVLRIKKVILKSKYVHKEDF
ncbi:MAG: Brix domain-containing protein [Sulfolobales archaeon]